jgi:hypothetical protein
MIGASTAIGVAGSVYPPAGRDNSHPSQETRQASRKPPEPKRSGALASAADALSQFISNSGFIDITASFWDSFARCLHYQPARMHFGDLEPGALKEITTLVKRNLTADPEQTLAAQARVRPAAALKLLK